MELSRLAWKAAVGLALALWLPCAALSAEGFDAFAVQDVRIEGLQRVSPGTVFRHLSVDIGDTLDADAAAVAIRALYATGYFRDIALEKDGDVLVVAVRENPTIAEVNFSGLDELEGEEMDEGLRRLGLGRALIFTRAALDRAADSLRRAYLERGFYNAVVTPTVSPLPRNRVAVNFDVSEGGEAVIREIRVIGAEAFSENELFDLFELRPSGFFSRWSDDDKYAGARFAADLERLRSHYLENGFLRFAVDSVQAELTPDRRGVHLIINILEGGQYAVAGHEFAGDSPLPEEEMRNLLTQTEGEIYRESETNAALRSLRDALGDIGRAFAAVNADPRINDETGDVILVYQIDAGPPVFVRRIDVVGNEATRDEVIRRELLQFERELYSREKITESMTRLRRLGFFDSVSHGERRVPDSPDEVDLEIEVAEGRVGSIEGGVGYSEADGIILRGALTQPNIFGTGNEFSLSAEKSDEVKRFSVAFTEAYITDSGISRRISASRTERESEEDTADFSLDSDTFELGYGIPISLEDVLNVSAAYEKVKINNVSSLEEEFRPFVDKHGDSPDAVLLRLGLVRDTRNARFNPTAGHRQRATAEWAVPGLDARYYRLSYTHDWYKELVGQFVLHTKGEVSVGDSYGGAVYPFYKRFYLGGPNSLRGFKSGTVGPSNAAGDAIGGKVRTFGTVEVNRPLSFGKRSREQKLFGALFVDAGSVFRELDDFSANGLRVSAGAEIRWVTPIGPIRLVYSQPLQKEKDDEVQHFQFTIGSF